jgi:hypothetical protein
MMGQSSPKPDPNLIDWSDLKERIRDAIRAAIQECADERGLTYDEFLDWFFEHRRAD